MNLLNSSKFRKTTIFLVLIPMLLLNCFGNFSLTRKVYQWNKGIAGNNLTGRLVKTLVMWAMVIVPVYPIASLVDFIILNLIEFWTGNNPVAFNEKGEYEKTVRFNDKNIRLTQFEFGKKMHIEFIDSNNDKEEFYALKDQPEKIFKIIDNKMEEVSFSRTDIGSSVIITNKEGKAIKSSKILNKQDVELLEKKLNIKI